MPGPYDIGTCYHLPVRWVWVLLFVAMAAQAAPQVEIRAKTQLSLGHVKLRDNGLIEVTGFLVDKLTGTVLASMIGMALFHRERTGQGQELNVPMLETILSFALIEHLWHGTLGEPEKGMGYPRMLTPHRRPYKTKDGYISVIAVSNAQWGKLFEAMGVGGLIDDPRFNSLAARAANVDALYATLTEGMQLRTTDEWLAELRPADIPCGRANSLEDLFEEPYLQETGFFAPAEHPVEGAVVVPVIPAWFSKSPPNVTRLWPTLGEHTREVLREAGYAEAEIDAIIG